MKNTQKGSTLVWVVVVVIIVAIGAYFYSSTTTVKVSDGGSVVTTQEENTMTNNTNSSSLKFGKCDWSKIKKISQLAHGKVSVSFNVVGNKLIAEDGTDSTFLKRNFCNEGAIASFVSNEDAGIAGYNKNGEWFDIPNNGKAAKMKIELSEKNGEKYISSEKRIVSPENGGVYIGIVKISITTGFMSSYLTMGIGGSDLMLSKSIEQIGNENPKLYIPVEYRYE
jgi:hypothetical protein